MMAMKKNRVQLDALNMTLKGYPAEQVSQLTQELPGAIARHFEHPDTPAIGLTGQVARQVASELRGKVEGEG